MTYCPIFFLFAIALRMHFPKKAFAYQCVVKTKSKCEIFHVFAYPSREPHVDVSYKVSTCDIILEFTIENSLTSPKSTYSPEA